MTQTEEPGARTPSTDHRTLWSWRRLFGKDVSTNSAAPLTPPPEDIQQRPGIARRLSRKVVPGLPRPGTFKRQQSELRDRLEAAKLNSDDRRTVSVDRRQSTSFRNSSTAVTPPHRLSAPELLDSTTVADAVLEPPQIVLAAKNDLEGKDEYVEVSNEPSCVDAHSISTETFDEMILGELEKRWILNLSMHFRDKSKREKFFVTFAETPTHWRRVTISLDYREAPGGSLEEELQRTRFQREKSARIYEAIRDSLPDIQFYDTVTNLKLQTENDRLHVHVVEDVSEVISYPPIKAINHLNCRRVREDALVFDSHLSGFVYKVRVDDQVVIKKEIPGPDSVDEFLYEINALHQLSGSNSVIKFGGVVLDNRGEVVKGLLISFAEQGALVDVIYDGEGRIPWRRREQWAKQIVQGLSEIHEAGFVQGDFTLSNIVIDGADDAKIIDINRRGCPVGWEPPEAAALIESNQRISMYIGVKSDLYQLGMVLYALATQQDEPETHRPLEISCFSEDIPGYYLDLCSRCLDIDPRRRSQASTLLTLFPTVSDSHQDNGHPIQFAVDACYSPQKITNGHKLASPLTLKSDFFLDSEKPVDVYGYAATDSPEEPYYPSRGRSPPAKFSQCGVLSTIPLSSLAFGYDDGGTLTADEALEPPVLQLNNDAAPANQDIDPSTYALPDSSIGSYLDTNKQNTPNEAVEPLFFASTDDNVGPRYTSDMEKQLTEEPRTTVALNKIPTGYPADLAFIGTAHVAPYKIVSSANLDDDLTTDTHNDRHTHADLAGA
ncbi:hypothetical protein PZA11_002032 [Diplocarpon coronariae]